ncbi:MAG TPA: glycosyl transferase family 2, partial [Dehalococcoidia bacterium]|nr:glycosyl transferase family 2 [Dehalococcoidia bacterium]
MALQAAQSTTGVADTPATVTYRPVMSRSDMIAFAALLFFAVLLTLRYAAWWFDPDNLPTNYAGSSIWLIALGNFVPFLALSMLEGLRILQMASMWLFAAVMRSAIPLPAPHGLRVAVLTTIVPSKEPLSMLEQTLKAMKLIRSPDPIDIWVLDEEDSPEVQYLCSRLGVNHFTRHGIAGYNQTPG